MPYTFDPFIKARSLSFYEFIKPLEAAMINMPPLHSKGDRSLQMTFEDHLKALAFYHLEDYESGQGLLQALEEDEFARSCIAPEKGIKKSSFSEANNHRGLEQFLYVFTNLQAQAYMFLPNRHLELGELVVIDGSLINASLSMYWADYRKNSKKGKAHMGFDVNRGIPRKIFLSGGNGGERPFVSSILSKDETGVMDRGYQCHEQFDEWQNDNKYFICRIKKSTHNTIVMENEVKPDSIVFFDAVVQLGANKNHSTKRSLRLVGHEVDGVEYWIATNRHDLSGEQIAQAYKLRWNIETFFGWWKKHMDVYHLIARSEHGVMVQILAGLITYLLLAIYCHRNFNEKVSKERVRSLRNKIQNELRASYNSKSYSYG